MPCPKCGAEKADSELCPDCPRSAPETRPDAAEFARIEPKRVRVELDSDEQEILKRQRAEYEAGGLVRDAEEHRRELQRQGRRGNLFTLIVVFLVFDLLLLLSLIFSD